MSASKSSVSPAPPRPWPGGWVWPPLLIVAAGVAAYANSFSGRLVLDDLNSIVVNPTIRHWATALTPVIGTTVGGRPVLNASLAVNYAISGTAVWSYHVLNLAIHLLAGLALFGITRRTLEPRVRQAGSIACSIALLWVLHPLQTEAVTYIIQRAESLMGLFYLLTLYGFIRGAQAGGSGGWYLLSWTACLLGMATKEVMATAPLIVLLYDRTFLAGSFRSALRHRWRIHAGLAATWVILPFLVLSTHGRTGSAGFGSGVSWWSYALTQFPAIVHYLRLCFWPHPLIFDYGSALTLDAARVLPAALIVAMLIAVTVWALWKRPTVGFLGACFFVILAPSSSVIPVATQTLAEHRMYLPLISVVALAVLGAWRWLGRAAWPVILVMALWLGWQTSRRNETYHTEEGLWSDTVARRPDNERAHNNLAYYLLEAGRDREGVDHYEEALRLKPDYIDAHYNLANVLAKTPGRLNDAIAHYEAALRLNPKFFQADVRLGNTLLEAGRPVEAIRHFEAALRANPQLAEAHYDLGNALEQMPGGLNDAITHFEAAVRLKPDFIEARNNLGNALSAVDRTPEAITQFEALLQLRPDLAPIHFNLALALLKTPGRTPEAAGHLRTVLRLEPGNAQARQLLDSLPSSP